MPTWLRCALGDAAVGWRHRIKVQRLRYLLLCMCTANAGRYGCGEDKRGTLDLVHSADERGTLDVVRGADEHGTLDMARGADERGALEMARGADERGALEMARSAKRR